MHPVRLPQRFSLRMLPYFLESNIIPPKKLGKKARPACRGKKKKEHTPQTVHNETHKNTRWMWFQVASQNTKLRPVINNFHRFVKPLLSFRFQNISGFTMKSLYYSEILKLSQRAALADGYC